MAEKNEFWEASFLADSANELMKHEKIAAKNQKVLLKNIEEYWNKLIRSLDFTHWDRQKAEYQNAAKRLRREKDVLELKLSKAEEEVASLESNCSSLKHQISELKNDMLADAQELENLQAKAKHVDEDVENKRKQMADQYKSVLLTKDEYKRFLECHIRLLESNENGNVFIFTFESVVLGDQNAMPKKSVKLLHCSTDNSWKLLETNPPLSNLNKLSLKLQKNQNIRGLLQYLRKALTVSS